MKQIFQPSHFALFTEYDFIKALRILKEKPLGRNQLMRALDLSEASTRSLMNKLLSLKYTEGTTRGISLTKKGENLVNDVFSRIEGPEKIDYGGFSSAFKAENSSHAVKIGIEQRDAAVKKGALGCMIFVFSDNKLKMPGAENVENVYIDVFDFVKQAFALEEGDVVVLAYANSQKQAEKGAWAAVRTLL